MVTTMTGNLEDAESDGARVSTKHIAHRRSRKNGLVGTVVLCLCFGVVQGRKSTRHVTPIVSANSWSTSSSILKTNTQSTTNHFNEKIVSFGASNNVYDVSSDPNLKVIKLPEDRLGQAFRKENDRPPDLITDDIKLLHSLSSMGTAVDTAMETEETPRLRRSIAGGNKKNPTAAKRENRHHYNGALDRSKQLQPVLGSGIAVIPEPFKENKRILQTDTCSPFNTAIPVPFDPTGETVTVITGDTTGASANLVGLGDCVVDSGAPTMWYRFTTTEPAVLGLTTCAEATSFDTTISLYAHHPGPGCEVFCLGQNDDHFDSLSICSNPAHSLIFLESLQNTYYIAVSGHDFYNYGSFELVLFAINDEGDTPNPASLPTPSPTLNPPPTLPPTSLPNPVPSPPECPGFDTAIPFDFDTTGEYITVITGNTTGASASLPVETGCSSNSRSPTKWYKFTISINATIGFTTCREATSFDTTITLFSQSSISGQCAYCLGQNHDHGTTVDFCSSSEHSLIGLEATPDTYFVAVSGQRIQDHGPFELVVFLVGGNENTPNPASTSNPAPQPTPAPTPLSGTCPLDGATQIDFDTTGETVTIVSGSTVGASASLPDLEGCVSDSGAPTVWYTFTIPIHANIGLTTCAEATTFDTTISLFQHDDQSECTTFCLGQNEDHGTTASFCSSSEHSLVLLEATPDTYYVAVSGQRSFDYGSFELVLFLIDDGTVPTPNPTPQPTLAPSRSPTRPPSAEPTPSPSTSGANSQGTIPSTSQEDDDNDKTFTFEGIQIRLDGLPALTVESRAAFEEGTESFYNDIYQSKIVVRHLLYEGFELTAFETFVMVVAENSDSEGNTITYNQRITFTDDSGRVKEPQDLLVTPFVSEDTTQEYLSFLIDLDEDFSDVSKVHAPIVPLPNEIQAGAAGGVDDDGGPLLGAILGGIIGGVVGIACCVVVVLVVVKKRGEPTERVESNKAETMQVNFANEEPLVATYIRTSFVGGTERMEDDYEDEFEDDEYEDYDSSDESSDGESDSDEDSSDEDSDDDDDYDSDFDDDDEDSDDDDDEEESDFEDDEEAGAAWDSQEDL